MDRRERFNDDTEMLRTALDGAQARMWTALPGIVESFDASKMTVSIQPAIQGRFLNSDGSYSWQNMPLCVDVPVKYFGNKKFICDFYLEKGDEGIIIFSSRCIDAWWQSGGVQRQAELRMHDLSDGMFLPGMYSQATLPPSKPKQNVMRLRTTDGNNFIQIDNSGNISATATTKLTLTAPDIEIRGPVTTNSTITASGEITGNGIQLSTHLHSGVTSGSANTGGPVS